ncbi:MAG: TIGR00266 family protein [Chloroflexi bacterium]|nr:MAG: TIGR00266 family protein [Chloroflexota bacterium]TMD53997.1 MAG: TIGR00266 family protein [Chloroflexota bacterium]
MEHQIVGTTLPVLEVTLQPQEWIIAESGELSWMTASIGLQSGVQVGGQSGGLFGAITRAISGSTIFMTQYYAYQYPGQVAFATKVPGSILPIDMPAGHSGYIVHRHGFLAGGPQIQLGIAMQQRLGGGIFGGMGLFMQRVTGQGLWWCELQGEVIEKDLQAGETIRVHPGHVGMLEASVQFSITTVPGIRNVLFGGDGLFLAQLTGPGKVWLQSLPLPNLAHALSHYLPHTEGSSGPSISFG